MNLEQALIKIKELEDSIVALKKRDDWLECLEQAGVDNWGGFSEARAIQRGDDPYD